MSATCECTVVDTCEPCSSIVARFGGNVAYSHDWVPDKDVLITRVDGKISNVIKRQPCTAIDTVLLMKVLHNQDRLCASMKQMQERFEKLEVKWADLLDRCEFVPVEGATKYESAMERLNETKKEM